MPQAVLLIEDNASNAALVERALLGSEEHRFLIERLRTCSEAQDRLYLDRAGAIAAVITNLFLPDSQGLQTIARLLDVCPHIPILVLTNLDHEQVAKQAVQLGAQDYVLQHRVASCLLPNILQNMLYRAAHAETLFAQKECARAALNSVGSAARDHLTGLANPWLFDDRLCKAIAAARRHGQPLAVLCVDIDRFKYVNDALGHAIGDELLRSIATRLGDSVRASDTVGRHAGNAFIVLLSELAHAEDAALGAQKILASLCAPYRIEDHQLQITASIGISVYPDDGDGATLVKLAHLAMLTAKEQGRNTFAFFKPHMNECVIENRFLECSLRHALSRQEFLLHFQPRIDLGTDAIVGAEVSVRWRPTEPGLMRPAEYLSAVQKSGYVIPIGQWALREACCQVRSLRAAGIWSIPVAMSVSAVELRSKGFADNVRAILRDSGLEPPFLEIELAEAVLHRDFQVVRGVLHDLKDLGVRLALDNFGTGVSSLSYLKRVPLDTLKIDRSLVRGLCTSAHDASIVDAVIGAGKCFHLRVVADGVETRGQFLALQSRQCAEGQGPYFLEPVPMTEFTKLRTGDLCAAPVE